MCLQETRLFPQPILVPLRAQVVAATAAVEEVRTIRHHPNAVTIQDAQIRAHHKSQYIICPAVHHLDEDWNSTALRRTSPSPRFSVDPNMVSLWRASTCQRRVGGFTGIQNQRRLWQKWMQPQNCLKNCIFINIYNVMCDDMYQISVLYIIISKLLYINTIYVYMTDFLKPTHINPRKR